MPVSTSAITTGLFMNARILAMTNELTDRGQERRDSILDAALTVFVRDGYHATKLTDISREAGCSVGTLYTYFENHEELLAAVLQKVQTEIGNASDEPLEEDFNRISYADALRASNRAYLVGYRANAKVMALLEQAAHLDEQIYDHRVARIRRYIDRNRRVIEQLSERGEIYPIDDPFMFTTALSVMISRLAYYTWVEGFFDDSDETLERVAKTIDDIWFRSLGLKTD